MAVFRGTGAVFDSGNGGATKRGVGATLTGLTLSGLTFTGLTFSGLILTGLEALAFTGFEALVLRGLEEPRPTLRPGIRGRVMGRQGQRNESRSV